MLLSSTKPTLPITGFQVFGERCSGTNYVEKLLQANFPQLQAPCIEDKNGVCLRWRYGWKHGFPASPVLPEDVLFVSVFRHPQTWLSSMFRNQWHVPKELRCTTFDQYVRAPVRTVADNKGLGGEAGGKNFGRPLNWDRHPITGEPFRNPMALRTAKSKGFMSYGARGTVAAVVRFEDVANHAADFISEIAESFALDSGPFVEVTSYKGRNGPPVTRESPAKPSQETLDFIWSELDAELETGLGYAPLAF